jgi:hypothetical protein
MDKMHKMDLGYQQNLPNCLTEGCDEKLGYKKCKQEGVTNFCMCVHESAGCNTKTGLAMRKLGSSSGQESYTPNVRENGVREEYTNKRAHCMTNHYYYDEDEDTDDEEECNCSHGNNILLLFLIIFMIMLVFCVGKKYTSSQI